MSVFVHARIVESKSSPQITHVFLLLQQKLDQQHNNSLHLNEENLKVR